MMYGHDSWEMEFERIISYGIKVNINVGPSKSIHYRSVMLYDVKYL